MKRAIGAILFVVYSIIAITVTVLLLSYNDYNISEVGGYTVYVVKDDALEPEYDQGSILLIKSTSDKHVKVGDEIFLYNVINSQEFEFVSATLEGKAQQGRQMAYTVSGGQVYSSDYFVGKADDTIVISSPWGTILSILESKWGYLFCIVIVSLLLFLQEVFDLAIELKYGGTKGTKAANVANARKAATKKGTNTKKASTTKSSSTKTTTTKTATNKSATASKATTAAKTVAKTVVATKEVNDTQTEE